MRKLNENEACKKHPSGVVYAHSLHMFFNIAGVYQFTVQKCKIITTEAQYHEYDTVM